MTNALIVWHPVALTMMIEHRQCQCGAEYSAPGPKLMIKKQRTANYKPTGVIKWERLNGSPVSYHLPREHYHFTTYISMCPNCFEQREPFMQGELFPQYNIPDPLFEAAVEASNMDAANEIAAAKKAGRKPRKRLTLDDF